MTASIHTTRIVVADDSEVLLELMTFAIGEMRGLYLVGAAEDGAKAVSFVVEESADVALLDTDLPGLNGFEAAAEILRARPQTHVVLHGQKANEVDRARARRLGLEVLNKLELLQTIEALARHPVASLPSAA
jgi:CheY-like chemotaxis protein